MECIDRLWRNLILAETYISLRTSDGRKAAQLIGQVTDTLGTKEWLVTPPTRSRASKIASYDLWYFWDVWGSSDKPVNRRNGLRFKTMALITEDRILDNVLPERTPI